MTNEDYRRGDPQRYEQRYQDRGRAIRDEWRDPNRSYEGRGYQGRGYEEGGSYASHPRDYYADEGRMRGARYVSPGGEYVGNRAPNFVPQRYEADTYSNQDYGDNRGASDWYTEDGLFGEPQYRGALDSDYGRRYEFEDRNAFGYGGYGRDMGRGRRSAVAYDRYGAYGYGSQLYHGKGPKGYRRSDERIREDVCDLLSDDPRIDASNLEVAVKECEVTLSGTVNSRYDKRLVEDLAEGISGVKDVHNTVRVAAEQSGNQPGSEQAKAASSRH